MALLGAFGLADWIARRFPLVLVRGIQASVALLLAKASVELAERGNWAGLPAVARPVGLAVAAGACLLLFALRGRRAPGTLLVLGGGAIAGVAISGGLPDVGYGPQAVGLSVPDAAAFGTALTTLVLAQLPLTFGNSVVATADAERSYFGDRAARVTPNRLAGSISGANLLAGLTHGLPLCHGAGGVTAHVKQGARSARATASVGALYLLLALVFGASLPPVMKLLLPGALAGMLLYVAIQHGLLAARLESAQDRVIAAGVGLVTLLSGNLAIGFGAGVLALVVRSLVGRLAGRPATATG
jgi:MFS superfamily sulfate permease-like transporter